MARRTRSGSNPAPVLATVRQIHVYIAALIAPSILFFAVSGGLQLFSFHEAHGGYHPPAVLEKLGMLHKKQTFVAKPKRPDRPKGSEKAPPREQPAKAEAPMAPAVRLLKWYFLLVAAGLAVSTLLGLWMGLVYNRRKAVVWLLAIVGTVIPIVLASLS